MFKTSDGTWMFVLCPKTFNFNNYCPFCSVSMKLFATGNATDKKTAYNYKRKEKFVGNVIVIDDPRDAEKEEDKKWNNTLRLWEFPGAIEKKFRLEMKDNDEALGFKIVDPIDGFDFLLKVGRRSAPDGGQFPVYDASQFSRKASALAETKEQIEVMISQAIDLDEYISSLSQSTTDEDIVQILKDEMLYDVGGLAQEIEKNFGIKSVMDGPDKINEKNSKIQEMPWGDKPKSDDTEEEPEPVEKTNLSDDELSDYDAQILKELDLE